MKEHGIEWREPRLQSESLSIANQPALPSEVVIKIAQPAIDLAADFQPNHDGIVFVDHSIDPAGIVLAEAF